jgi:hypothetical protein
MDRYGRHTGPVTRSSRRKTHSSKIGGSGRRVDGIFIAPFEQGEIGPDLFRAACTMGLEGLVAKRQDRPSRRPVAARGEVKNPASAAMTRAREVEWSRR